MVPPEQDLSRRTLLNASGAIIAGAALPWMSKSPSISSKPISRLDTGVDAVVAYNDLDNPRLLKRKGNVWQGDSIEVTIQESPNGAAFSLSTSKPITRIMVRWKRSLGGVQSVLGDHWERAYGDLAWRSVNPAHPMPWYFFACTGEDLFAVGVLTQPNCHCFWTLDLDGINLWCDVRSGGSPLELGARTLALCTVLSQFLPNEPSAMQGFSKNLMGQNQATFQRVLGFNDWDFDYGTINRDIFMQTTSIISGLGGSHPKYAVVDAGWSTGGTDARPYDRGAKHIGPMTEFADDIRKRGCQPGLWYRPLIGGPGIQDAWRQTRDQSALDPTLPAVIDLIQTDVKRFRKWGFDLLKHDFSTWDMTGRWGFQMGPSITKYGWSFADRSRTNAEITLNLYRAIREAAGPMVIIGCNTYSHLSAGIFDLNRTGDDTSGRVWERTRKMGVNALAFRSVQNHAFYQCDPDMAPVTKDLPWPLAKNYLMAVARAGQALFVSPELNQLGDKQLHAIDLAFRTAAMSTGAYPVDWHDNVTPSEWRAGKTLSKYDWMASLGSWPFPD